MTSGKREILFIEVYVAMYIVYIIIFIRCDTLNLQINCMPQTNFNTAPIQQNWRGQEVAMQANVRSYSG